MVGIITGIEHLMAIGSGFVIGEKLHLHGLRVSAQAKKDLLYLLQSQDWQLHEHIWMGLGKDGIVTQVITARNILHGDDYHLENSPRVHRSVGKNGKMIADEADLQEEQMIWDYIHGTLALPLGNVLVWGHNHPNELVGIIDRPIEALYCEASVSDVKALFTLMTSRGVPRDKYPHLGIIQDIPSHPCIALWNSQDLMKVDLTSDPRSGVDNKSIPRQLVYL